MLIHVTYTDDSFDYVKDFMLEALIASGSITRFKRSSGWVDVGSASVRRAQPPGGYSGVERRILADRRLIDRSIIDRRGKEITSDESRSSESRTPERSTESRTPERSNTLAN